MNERILPQHRVHGHVGGTLAVKHLGEGATGHANERRELDAAKVDGESMSLQERADRPEIAVERDCKAKGDRAFDRLGGRALLCLGIVNDRQEQETAAFPLENLDSSQRKIAHTVNADEERGPALRQELDEVANI